MRYMLMCCFNERQWKKIPKFQQHGIMREYGELVQSLVDSGRYVAGGKLQSVSTAATVRGKNGTPTVTDGPFAETKEQLSGYHLVECKDLNEAISIAGRIPTIPFGGTVEVRPMEGAEESVPTA